MCIFWETRRVSAPTLAAAAAASVPAWPPPTTMTSYCCRARRLACLETSARNLCMGGSFFVNMWDAHLEKESNMFRNMGMMTLLMTAVQSEGKTASLIEFTWYYNGILSTFWIFKLTWLFIYCCYIWRSDKDFKRHSADCTYNGQFTCHKYISENCCMFFCDSWGAFQH